VRNASADSWTPLSVTVPTRNRPEKLERCLAALGRARERVDFRVYVCDSSTPPHTWQEVADVCNAFDFVELRPHAGTTAAAARNICVRAARSDLVLTVDDDVYVESDTVLRLLQAYERGNGRRVVAGSIRLSDKWTTPVVMRPIGYGRGARVGEVPSFLITGLLLYPRAFGIAWPWHEKISRDEDRFMGALWRRHSVRLYHEPSARATHDGPPRVEQVDVVKSHVYVNLFDALIANPNAVQAVAYQLLGFAAGAKLHCRRPRTAARYVQAWLQAYRAVFRDRHHLRALCATRPPPAAAVVPVDVGSTRMAEGQG
jgi:glycosyltransferase involved in cell wall biosynthesis